MAGHGGRLNVIRRVVGLTPGTDGKDHFAHKIAVPEIRRDIRLHRSADHANRIIRMDDTAGYVEIVRVLRFDRHELHGLPAIEREVFWHTCRIGYDGRIGIAIYVSARA